MDSSPIVPSSGSEPALSSSSYHPLTLKAFLEPTQETVKFECKPSDPIEGRFFMCFTYSPWPWPCPCPRLAIWIMDVLFYGVPSLFLRWWSLGCVSLNALSSASLLSSGFNSLTDFRSAIIRQLYNRAFPKLDDPDEETLKNYEVLSWLCFGIHRRGY